MEVFMDLITLKKKLSTYTSSKGYIKNVSDDVLFEILTAWENWTGPSKEFYKALGFSQTQLASLVGKAKKMKREGYFGEETFKEIKLETIDNITSLPPCSGVEVIWKNGQVLRFSQVDLLIDFLKKAA
jgi:hypothetical protein